MVGEHESWTDAQVVARRSRIKVKPWLTGEVQAKADTRPLPPLQIKF